MVDTAIDPEIYRSATGDLIGVVLLALLAGWMLIRYLFQERRKGIEVRAAAQPGPVQGLESRLEEPEPHTPKDEEIRKAA
ncbi:MAG: hypothetical protein HZA60_10565 [Deltaproteobacteria bacterium]|nr:hypothetical protein [Deltaproteobacteria bacterium]